METLSEVCQGAAVTVAMSTHFPPTASHRVNFTRATPTLSDAEAANVTEPDAGTSNLPPFVTGFVQDTDGAVVSMTIQKEVLARSGPGLLMPYSGYVPCAIVRGTVNVTLHVPSLRTVVGFPTVVWSI